MFDRDFTLQSILNRAIVRLAVLLLVVSGLLGYYLVDWHNRFEQARFEQAVRLMAGQLESLLPDQPPVDGLQEVSQWQDTVEELLPEISYDLIFVGDVMVRQVLGHGDGFLLIALSNRGWYLEVRELKTPLQSIVVEPLAILSVILLVAILVLYLWGKKLVTVMMQDLTYIQNTVQLLVAEKSDSMIVEPRLYIREYKGFFSQLKKTILSIHEAADRAFSRDSLTAMPDGKQLEHQKKKIYEMASRNVEMMLVLLDIDDLSSINMIYGNETGDRLVKGIGNIIKGAIRTTDDSFYLGDGKFLIVLVGMKAPEALKWYEFMTRRYEMLRVSLGEYHETAPEVSVSASAAQVSKSDQSLDDTLYRLGDVLTSVKQRSKGIIVMARDKQDQDSVKSPEQSRKDPTQAEEFHHPWQ